MQNKSHEGVDPVNANEVNDSQLVEMPQQLSNEYFKFRLWVSFLGNVIVWTMTTGLICGVVLVLNLIKSYLGPDPSIPGTHGELLALILLYVIPMFTCIRLHKWWLVRYFRSYRWELTNEALHIQEGVFTRKDTNILLSTIKGTGIAQGHWERKYGWYKVTILTGENLGDSKGVPTSIAARIFGCQDPLIIQELIEKAASEFKKLTGN